MKSLQFEGYGGIDLSDLEPLNQLEELVIGYGCMVRVTESIQAETFLPCLKKLTVEVPIIDFDSSRLLLGCKRPALIELHLKSWDASLTWDDVPRLYPKLRHLSIGKLPDNSLTIQKLRKMVFRLKKLSKLQLHHSMVTDEANEKRLAFDLIDELEWNDRKTRLEFTLLNPNLMGPALRTDPATLLVDVF